MPDVLEQLATDIRARMDAIAGAMVSEERITELMASAMVSEERITELIREFLSSMTEEDSGTLRKLVFGREGDPHLVGSKFARWGLSIGDIELAHDILESAQGIGRSKGPSEDLRNAVKALSERKVLTPAASRSADEDRLSEMYDQGVLDRAGYQRATQALDQVYGRAMDTAETGFGLQLVGVQYVAELWRGARAASRIFSQIPTFEMGDPTAYLPVEAALPEMLFVAENTANNSAEYGTSKTASQRVQVDAKKFVIHQIWSGEMEEDSIVPFVPFLREQAARSLGHHSDSLVLNGDTTNAGTGNINLDDADPADTKHYLAFDGIRHAALVDNTGNASDVAGPITLARLLKARGLMLDTARLHDWGHPDVAEDLIYAADPETCDQVALLDEVVTVDKFGAQATVLTGQQARIGPHPLIVSQAVSKTEADGKVSTTAGNNTKGQVVAFNRRGFVAGWRRQVKVETERLAGRDQNRLVYSMRLGFGRFTPTGAASGIEAAAVLYDISL